MYLDILTPYIMKTRLYNFDPLEPHCYIVKLGFTGVHFSSYFCSKHRSWVLDRTASLISVYVLSGNTKNIRFFSLKIFIFWWYSVHLNRHVFVITCPKIGPVEEGLLTEACLSKYLG